MLKLTAMKTLNPLMFPPPQMHVSSYKDRLVAYTNVNVMERNILPD
jgi:hypothetical protein